MADVTGPFGSLPGSRHLVPRGMVCDNHQDRPAVARIQGETDSMGSEMRDWCEECHRQHLTQASEADKSGYCELCDENMPVIKKWRDPDEGRCGRIYDACTKCIGERNRQFLEDNSDFFHGL